MISQADIMFPETTSSGSKALSIFIAVLVLLVVAGGVSWFYFNSRSNDPQPVTATPTTDQPTTETTAVPEATINTAPTDIATALSQLDNELSIINQDELADDDSIDL